MPSQPLPQDTMLKALATFDTETTLILVSGVEFPCRVVSIIGGPVHFETELSMGMLAASSIVGFYTNKL